MHVLIRLALPIVFAFAFAMAPMTASAFVLNPGPCWSPALCGGEGKNEDRDGNNTGYGGGSSGGSSSTDDFPITCNVDSDCNSGFSCVGGICSEETIVVTGDAPNVCGANGQWSPVFQRCSCFAGYEWNGASCVAEGAGVPTSGCVTDTDCPIFHTCNTGTSQCEFNGSVPGGGQSTRACEEDSDCPDSMTCEDGTCEPEPPPPTPCEQCDIDNQDCRQAALELADQCRSDMTSLAVDEVYTFNRTPEGKTCPYWLTCRNFYDFELAPKPNGEPDWDTAKSELGDAAYDKCEINNSKSKTECENLWLYGRLTTKEVWTEGYSIDFKFSGKGPAYNISKQIHITTPSVEGLMGMCQKVRVQATSQCSSPAKNCRDAFCED